MANGENVISGIHRALSVMKWSVKPFSQCKILKTEENWKNNMNSWKWSINFTGKLCITIFNLAFQYFLWIFKSTTYKILNAFSKNQIFLTFNLKSNIKLVTWSWSWNVASSYDDNPVLKSQVWKILNMAWFWIDEWPGKRKSRLN